MPNKINDIIRHNVLEQNCSNRPGDALESQQWMVELPMLGSGDGWTEPATLDHAAVDDGLGRQRWTMEPGREEA